MQQGPIDNQTRFLGDEIKKILPSTESIDICVGYFFFSGFSEIRDYLKDKKIRVLVGMELDPKILNEFEKHYADRAQLEENKKRYSNSRTEKKANFLKTVCAGINTLKDFDDETDIDTLELLFSKLEDGTMEIRMSAEPNHAKYYVFNLSNLHHLGGLLPSVVIMGSSNWSTNGLYRQGELNHVFYDQDSCYKYKQLFENNWNNSKAITLIDKSNAKESIQIIKNKAWMYQTPSPYYMFLKVLQEYYQDIDNQEIVTPSDITKGRFGNFQYQLDAIKQSIAKLKEHNGIIIADVVGLGKSIIASTVAYNMYKEHDLYTVIISPPHLMEQWEDYMLQFDFKGKVYSSGKIEECFEFYKNDDKPKLIILDEAHRYKNELNHDYTLLHQLCINQKVLLLSATPFNNDPKDIYALIKLFQIPGAATLKTVENLGLAFRDLIIAYLKLKKENRKGNNKNIQDIENKTKAIANELRRMIDEVVIRRSRLDLENITKYKEDLKSQKIAFPKVNSPELLEYNLGNIESLYLNTLNTLHPYDGDPISGINYMATRYQPVTYLTEDGKKKYKEELSQLYDEEEITSKLTQTAQSNMAKFMRRLLVQRFESSQDSFRTTLDKLIASNEVIIQWYKKLQCVPIYKRGTTPDIEGLLDEASINETMDLYDPVEELREVIAKKNLKNFEIIKTEYLDPKYLDDLENDGEVLKQLRENWFGSGQTDKNDPKLGYFKEHLLQFLSQSEKRKVIVFSEFSDTVNYLYKELNKDKDFKDLVFKYTSKDANKDNKKIIARNFDAGLPASEQENKYRILIATDAIAEGYNLHRADTIYNYDIPYNPTRVIQRIGRINRINKKMFDELFIFNFFPTHIGESETRTKAISTLKITLFNALLGDDTQKLTNDEELKSYYSEKFTEAQNQDEAQNTDTKYINLWNNIKDNKALREEANKVVNRSRVARETNDKNHKGVLLFGKRGDNSVFSFTDRENTHTAYIDPVQALQLFEATEEIKGIETTSDFNTHFIRVRDYLSKSNTHAPTEDKGRNKAIDRLKALINAVDSGDAKDYLRDLIDVIHELDALAESELKIIRHVKIKGNPEKAYQAILDAIPSEYISNIHKAAKSRENDKSLIILAEELL